MSKKNEDLGWNFFEGIYENTLKKGETFSPEMGEVRQKELEKMKKEQEEWLKKKTNGNGTN